MVWQISMLLEIKKKIGKILVRKMLMLEICCVNSSKYGQKSQTLHLLTKRLCWKLQVGLYRSFLNHALENIGALWKLHCLLYFCSYMKNIFYLGVCAFPKFFMALNGFSSEQLYQFAHYTLFFYYIKNKVNKNIEAEIARKIRTI